MQALYLEIKNLIITTLNLDELTADDIETEAALFGDGLGLDSIDALELGLAVKNEYAGIFHSRATCLRIVRYDRTKSHLRRSLLAAGQAV